MPTSSLPASRWGPRTAPKHCPISNICRPANRTPPGSRPCGWQLSISLERRPRPTLSQRAGWPSPRAICPRASLSAWHWPTPGSSPKPAPSSRKRWHSHPPISTCCSIWASWPTVQATSSAPAKCWRRQGANNRKTSTSFITWRAWNTPPTGTNRRWHCWRRPRSWRRSAPTFRNYSPCRPETWEPWTTPPRLGTII